MIIACLLIPIFVIINTTQAATEVNGIINSDTTWTKAGSPYSLSGPVAVSEGATLIVEPGATINFNNNYILVNGSLFARGSNEEKIIFNGGGNNAQIQFKQVSSSWNEITQSGSIIEKALLTEIWIDINSTSPKISYNTIIGHIDCKYSASLISNNEITGFSSSRAIFIFKSSARISSNLIHNLNTGIDTLSDSSNISGNTVIGGYTGIIYLSFNDSYVLSKNTVYGSYVGIKSGSFCRVEENIIVNNYQGIVCDQSIVRKNTIVNNTFGIIVYPTPLINYNNIYGNSENIHLAIGEVENVDAANNWWGTIDAQAIAQTIHDNRDDFTLGKVNFTPFLNSPNPDAPDIPNEIYILPFTSPTTPATTNYQPTSTAIHNQPDSGSTVLLGLDLTEIAIIALLGVISVLLVFVLVFLQGKNKLNS